MSRCLRDVAVPGQEGMKEMSKKFAEVGSEAPLLPAAKGNWTLLRQSLNRLMKR